MQKRLGFLSTNHTPPWRTSAEQVLDPEQILVLMPDEAQIGSFPRPESVIRPAGSDLEHVLLAASRT